MDKRLERLEEKSDKILEEISHINKTLVKNTADLEHHILRTSLAEENLELLRDEVKPLTKAKAMADGALKLVGAVATLAGIVVGALKLFL